MEILDFDPFALEAIYLDREPGPHDVIEPLPKAVNDWKNRLHPTTKKATKLVDISWQKNMGTLAREMLACDVSPASAVSSSAMTAKGRRKS